MSHDPFQGSSLPYPYTLEAGWWNVEQFYGRCREDRLDPVLRMALASDGSMIRSLSAYHLGPVRFEIQNQETAPLDREAAKFLEAQEGDPAIFRDVWMGWERGASSGRDVYARSVILGSPLSPWIAQELRKGKRPVGVLLEDLGLPVLRDRIQIGRLRSAALAAGIGSPETVFWARVYRLSSGSEFRAAVLEILLPESGRP